MDFTGISGTEVPSCSIGKIMKVTLLCLVVCCCFFVTSIVLTEVDTQRLVV